MKALPETALPLPSPCVGICRMSIDGSVCEGCLRTLDEIAMWGGASEGERRKILALVAQRSSKGQPLAVTV